MRWTEKQQILTVCQALSISTQSRCEPKRVGDEGREAQEWKGEREGGSRWIKGKAYDVYSSEVTVDSEHQLPAGGVVGVSYGASNQERRAVRISNARSSKGSVIRRGMEESTQSSTHNNTHSMAFTPRLRPISSPTQSPRPRPTTTPL